ncbi:phage major capsid protein [Streptomyces sp. STCH 565 A]|uniref:phage major capsid protein n=1 Tax=Streptomyces sp. STCH 565 A TaxID=2950532 RepID=UPI0020750E03|nr:phage major capsid protein [Streptomyces sp. STCH 565 A]MCM8555349.1 phage major capsid protein [Streptomyces sp. STCH 565 A]
MAPTSTVPRNADELAEMLAEPKTLKDIVASREALTEFITAYGNAQQADGTELNRLVAEETQRVFAKMMRENGMQDMGADAIKRLDLDPQAKKRGMLTSHRKGTAHNPAAPGAALDQHFTDSVEYVQAIWHKTPAAEAAEKLSILRNAAGSVSPADGGFLVPETLRSQLLQIALEQSVVRPLATVVPMDSARVPMPIIDSTTNRGSVYGGMIAYWGEEGAMLQDSNPKFGRVELDAKKLTGLSAVPNELLQDSIVSFASLIETLWPQALAFSEDNAFMVGTGAGMPLGFLGSKNKAAIAVARGGASTITYPDIVNMYAQMLPSSLSRAVWICSPDALPQLLQMSLDVGTGGNSVFVVNAAGPAPMTIFGRPLIISEKAGQLGARGDIAFVDLSYYLVGDRQTMTADSSTDYQFGSDKTTFRIIQRVDGRPWLQSAITPANGSTKKLSPFIELAA